MADGAATPGPAAHLVLVGLPGAGKSTVGALVAESLGRPFVDFDAEIERREGASIAALFAQHGEHGFRDLERALTAELAAVPDPRVLAPGGGWITRPETVALLRPRGVVVYLRATPAVALERLGPASASRPLLTADPLGALERLLAQRAPLYDTADHVIDTDGLDPWRVAARVVQLAGSAEHR